MKLEDCLNISYFLFSYEFTLNQDTITNKEIIPNYTIIKYINYTDLSAIFLLGLFTSLCTLTFCFYSKKTVSKYYVIQQEPNIIKM